MLGTGIAHPSTAIRIGDLAAQLPGFSAEKAKMDYETYALTHMGAETVYVDQEGKGIVHYLGEAARQAIAHAGLTTADIGAVVVATASGKDPISGIRGSVLSELDLHEAHCIELVSACTGFLEALLVGSDRAKASGDTVLVVAGDLTRTIFAKPHDYVNAALLGDGAAAAVLGPGTPGMGLREGQSTTNADWRTTACVDQDGYFVMDAHALRTRIPQAFSEQFLQGCARNGFDPANTVAIPHQTNGHLLDVLRDQLGIAPERFVNVFHKYGNCGNGSIGLALHHAFRDGHLRRGTNAVMFGAGGGFNWGHLGFTADHELLEQTPFQVLFVDENRDDAEALASAMAAAARADDEFRKLYRFTATVESSGERALQRLRDDAGIQVAVMGREAEALSDAHLAEVLKRHLHNLGFIRLAGDAGAPPLVIDGAGFTRTVAAPCATAALWQAVRDSAAALRNRDVNIP